MTDIEELVRESLRTAPPVVPSVSDPLGAVSRRVLRARAFAGAGVMAAVVAVGVALPLALRTSTGAGRLVPVAPSPATSVPASPPAPDHEVTVWDRDGLAVTAGGGYLWELRHDATSGGNSTVNKLDPATRRVLSSWKVTGGDAIAYGGDLIWVFTHSTHEIDMVNLGGVVQAVDVASGRVGSYDIGRNDAMDNVTALPQPDGRADALAAIGASIRQLRFENGAIRVVASMPLSKAGYVGESFGPVVPTGAGDYWLADSGRLVQLDLRAGSNGLLELGGQPKDSVDWSGGLLGTGGQDSVWVFDGGRVVNLSPKLLHQGSSVAQGDRVPVPGDAVEAVDDGEGGLFVTVGETQVVVKGARPGLYHVTKAVIEAGGGVTASTPSLPGVVPTQLAPDGHGGVDFVTAEGVAEHWQG